ncbi:hypothetical protein [Streptomyces phaeofaciens]
MSTFGDGLDATAQKAFTHPAPKNVPAQTQLPTVFCEPAADSSLSWSVALPRTVARIEDPTERQVVLSSATWHRLRRLLRLTAHQM